MPTKAKKWNYDDLAHDIHTILSRKIFARQNQHVQKCVQKCCIFLHVIDRCTDMSVRKSRPLIKLFVHYMTQFVTLIIVYYSIFA